MRERGVFSIWYEIAVRDWYLTFFSKELKQNPEFFNSLKMFLKNVYKAE